MSSASIQQKTGAPGALFAVLWLAFASQWAVAADAPTRGTDLRIEHTPIELVGRDEAARYRRILDPERPISWEVYYPAHDGDSLPGVFVYISPMRSGRIDSRWRGVMDHMNLVYIGANESGNDVLTNERVVKAVFAVRALSRRISFDPSRIHVAGFSGGGRMASLAASQYPDVFTAALYICGVNFWNSVRNPAVERITRNRFVFLTGSADFNLSDTRRVHRRYLEAGASNSKLMVIEGMGHQHPDAEDLTRALEYLAGDNAH